LSSPSRRHLHRAATDVHREIASRAFAMLFNSSARTVFAVGLLASGANSLRLVLNDMGMMLAPAAFFAEARRKVAGEQLDVLAAIS